MTTLEIILLVSLIYFLITIATMITVDTHGAGLRVRLALFGFTLILVPWMLFMSVRYMFSKKQRKTPSEEDKE